MLFVSTTIAAVFNIIFTYLFIHFWGSMGAAIATTVSYFLVYIIRRIDAKKYIEISSNFSLCLIEIAIMIFHAVVVIIDVPCYSLLLSVISFVLIIILNRDITIKIGKGIQSKCLKKKYGNS